MSYEIFQKLEFGNCACTLERVITIDPSAFPISQRCNIPLYDILKCIYSQNSYSYNENLNIFQEIKDKIQFKFLKFENHLI